MLSLTLCYDMVFQRTWKFHCSDGTAADVLANFKEKKILLLFSTDQAIVPN